MKQLLVEHQGQIYTLNFPEEVIEAAKLIVLLNQSTLPKAVKNALLVHLADDVNMFGQTVKDTITPEAEKGLRRSSVQVHPYPWQPSGASDVVVCQNEAGELFVALVYNQRRDKRPHNDPLRQKAVPHTWSLPEGYYSPKPCKGGEEGISKIPSDQMDEAEELMLQGNDLSESYQRVAKTLKDKPQDPSLKYDANLQACARREAKEEIGLIIPDSAVELITVRSETNSTVAVYLMDIGNSLPSLEVDNIEIAYATWGKVNQFQLDTTKGELRVTFPYITAGQEYPVEVPLKYALMIGQGIQHFRNKEIGITSETQFSNAENIEARIIPILKSNKLNPWNKTITDILGPKPESLVNSSLANIMGETNDEREKNSRSFAALGEYAEDYHQKILRLAKGFVNQPADELIDVDTLIQWVESPLAVNNEFARPHYKRGCRA